MGSTGEPVGLAEGRAGLCGRILVYSHDPLRLDQFYKSRYASVDLCTLYTHTSH